ncbi:hypothetical protein GOP47_0028702 [Adiantum capillus-veneris]|nr:hypothetical protein GOP47_0028702 [Adiantum capillus-veneris]
MQANFCHSSQTLSLSLSLSLTHTHTHTHIHVCLPLKNHGHLVVCPYFYFAHLLAKSEIKLGLATVLSFKFLKTIPPLASSILQLLLRLSASCVTFILLFKTPLSLSLSLSSSRSHIQDHQDDNTRYAHHARTLTQPPQQQQSDNMPMKHSWVAEVSMVNKVHL